MNLVYGIKEAFSGFAKARLSFAITVFTVFFLLFILGVVATLTLNMNRLVTVLNANHDIQVFLANTLNDAEIEQLKNELIRTENVKSVQYISKEDAAAEFKREFGDDIFDALDENPLPASFIIQMGDDNQQNSQIDEFAKLLQERPEVDEVVLQQEALNTLVKFSGVSRIIMYVLLFLVFLGSLFMISNTIRLIIIARQTIIDTMKLVGATSAFIRRPFLIEGIVQGTLGGFFSAFLLFLIFNIVNLQWPGLIVLPNWLSVAIIGTGLVFGYIGSQVAIKRFL
jgi:cell division transport system permease protein